MTSPAPAGSVPLLSVIIITWNGWADTERCLSSIYAAAMDGLEIIVFDNASSDGTPDWIERDFPGVRLIRHSRNIGHSAGFNLAITAARGTHVLLLDSDTELAGDAMSVMLAFLIDRTDVALIAPRLLNSDGSVQQSARNFPRPLNGLFGRQSLLTRLFPRNRFSMRYLRSDRISASEPYEVEQITGACMMFRRDVATQIGSWDEGYFAYWVDTDWCFRAGAAGWKVYCVPKAIVIHHEQNRRGKRKSARRIWMFHYGAYRFYRKSMTWGVLDPRAILAAGALTAHGLLQLAQNVTLPRDKPLESQVPPGGLERSAARASGDSDSLY
jgi:N-acetylglucosaminyl-diphospho-decaprenol L-rhamnosyltransferase